LCLKHSTVVLIIFMKFNYIINNQTSSFQKKKKKGKYEMVKLSVLKIDCLREYTDSNNNI
jgi:hypothetical protein